MDDRSVPKKNRSMAPGRIIPELPYPDVAAAIEWLVSVFGFKERLRIGDHRAQMLFEGASFIVVEDPPGEASETARLSAALTVRLEDVDRHHRWARDHGARIVNPPTVYPYGERQYTALDLAGNRWTFSQTIADVDPAAWGGAEPVGEPIGQGPPAKEAPLTSGVAEVVLNVDDLPLMRDFYRTVLGFKLHRQACHETGSEPEPEGEPTIAFLEVMETNTPLGRNGHPQLLALIDFRRHVFAKPRFHGVVASLSTLNHLAFEILPESFEFHRRRLESLGLNPQPAEFPAMSARALFFNDPEGNLLELICHHQAKAHD